ncbi:hypothetical protein NQ291_25055, partial [Escherichia coli]|nr:hypothetical protein [Escherichia coli]
MLELQLLALEIAAAYRFTAVSPNPAPWPKASVTLVPPPMTIDIEVREVRPSILHLGEEAEQLPYIPPVGAASISTL